MPTSIGNPQMIRHFNEYLILELIVQYPGLSRAEISRRTGISKPTVSAAVQQLLDRQLICETGLDSNQQGRKGQVLEFNANVFYLFVLDIGPEGIATGIADLSGHVVAGEPVLWTECGDNPDEQHLASLLLSRMHQCAEQLSITPQHIRFASAGIPAVVDPVTGRIQTLLPQLNPYMSLLSSTSLSKQLGMEVLLDNDVNLAAAAEKQYGVAKTAVHFAYLYLGEGVGAGLMIDDKLYRGLHGAAGEIGQSATSLTAGSSGQHRRLEQQIGSEGLRELMADYAAQHPNAGLDGWQVEQLLDAAAQGQPAAQSIVQQYVERLVLPLSQMTALLSPEMIVFGGPIGSQAELFVPQLQQSLQPFVPAMPQLKSSALSDSAVMRGAARAGVQRAFVHIREDVLAVGTPVSIHK
ncbi:ROK family transcriptional regulator [Paenibacillus sp. WLX1005]|uniref:ROK family transcriptional regulator n=1 Tax=Paenibacillus sp. WLX1005 TaxID=3243766 RepID=UPI0039845F0E